MDSSSIPLHLISLARIIIFMIAILVHGRLVEWTARLDFLWQLQASQEKKEMDVLQESNKRILHNLLPAHVAAHFLDNQFRSNMVNNMLIVALKIPTYFMYLFMYCIYVCTIYVCTYLEHQHAYQSPTQIFFCFERPKEKPNNYRFSSAKSGRGAT